MLTTQPEGVMLTTQSKNVKLEGIWTLEIVNCG